MHKQAAAVYQQAHPNVHRAAQSRHNNRVTALPWQNKLLSRMSYDPDIAYDSDKIVKIGSMNYKCQWCNALKWKDEPDGMCCSNGKVQLKTLHTPPEPLYSLIMVLHPFHDHRHFIDNARKYITTVSR